MKTVVVTGVSTGIGHGIARFLVARGLRVFGSVRSAADGARLAAELGPGFTPLVFDVTDEAAIHAGAAIVAAALDGATLHGLVNNAGIAVVGPLLYLTPEEFAHQLAVNVVGPMTVTQAFAPLLGADKARRGKPGRIVNISSVGGTSATPFVGAYNTSKFALEGFSQALRRELMLFGIDVIVVAPGAVATPIWDKGTDQDARFAATPYAPALAKMRKFMLDAGHDGLPAEKIAKGVHGALTDARSAPRIAIAPDPLQNFLANHLPTRMVDWFIARLLGLKP